MPFADDELERIVKQIGGTYYEHHGPAQFMDKELYEFWVEKPVEDGTEFDVGYVVTKDHKISAIYQNFSDFAISINRMFEDYSSKRFDQELRRLLLLAALVIIGFVVGVFSWIITRDGGANPNTMLVVLASVVASAVTFVFGRWVIFKTLD